MIEKVVKKKKLKDKDSNYSYWITRPVEERLEALEKIREEYNSWKYADKQGFQRVFRIIKRK